MLQMRFFFCDSLRERRGTNGDKQLSVKDLCFRHNTRKKEKKGGWEN